MTANTYHVAIIGGHTERTSAVNRIVVSVTAIGKNTASGVIRTGGAKAGDFIYMSKWAGLEGTGIIAVEKRQELLAIMKATEIETARQMLVQTSVLREGAIGKQCGATSMHDITEGGVLGAAYEISEASGLGCELHKTHIPIHPVTDTICNHFLIDPLKLIASGSMMLTIAPEKAPALEQAFIAAGIAYAKIGVMTETPEKVLIYGDFEIEEIRETIAPPEGDALYEVLE
jgi:hydrogenase expression/formation protein HypE